jgi:putative tryptophan/tyrosine transport system substrate-binding protein
MKRRDLITVAAMAAASGGAVAWPLFARAQAAAMPVIGFLHGGVAGEFTKQVAAFQEGLLGAGYTEGRNVSVEYRWAEGHFDRLPALADDLVRRHVTVIAAIGGEPVARAAMNATSAIPIVFMVGQDVVRSGLVASLNRPGGNVTGVTLFVTQLVPKQMELLHRVVPNAAAIAVLANSNDPVVLPDSTDLEKGARANGMTLLLLNATTTEEIDAAFAAMIDHRAGALLVPGDAFFTSRRGQIVTLAKRHAIPAIYAFREYAAAGGLMSYGNNLNDTIRLAAVYVARILKGEKPGDLPVMQPTKFELVINTTTAKILGLAIPPTLLAIADDVIE